MSVGTWASIINLTICFAIPLMLVALGGMYSERSGVINLALEGIMIIGALASTLFLRALDAAGWGESVFTSQLGVALAALIAGVAGMLFSLLLAFAAINLKADQTIGGTALNLFAPAFCVVVSCTGPALACGCGPAASIPRQRTLWASTYTKCVTPA